MAGKKALGIARAGLVARRALNGNRGLMYIPYRRTLMPHSRIRFVKRANGKGIRSCMGYVTEILILKMKPQWAVVRALLHKPQMIDPLEVFLESKTSQEVKRINDPMIESYQHFCYIDHLSGIGFEVQDEEWKRAKERCNELNHTEAS
jgi:hypothetical protein